MLHILASVLAYDIWFYLSHVLLHSSVLYKYHKQHHVHVHPTWPDTYDADLVESAFQGIGMFFPYAFVTYTVADTAIILLVLNVRGALRHDPRGTWIVGDYHLIHHANPSYNYGEPWLDRLCGTANPAPSKPTPFT
jgi:lathosterol oxidase